MYHVVLYGIFHNNLQITKLPKLPEIVKVSVAMNFVGRTLSKHGNFGNLVISL